MKKILTLLLLFTITLFYSIPSEAYTLNGNDIPLVQTKNLFDKDGDLVLDVVILGSGGITGSPGDFYTNYYIPILPSTVYRLSATSNDALRIPFYDSSFSFISRTLFTGTNSQSFTTPSNAFYLRISMSQLNLNSIQLELGATQTSYAPYGFLTLNDIFLDGNMVLNHDFSNGTTNWINTLGSTFTLTNQILTVSNASSNTAGAYTNVISVLENDLLYSATRLKAFNDTRLHVSRSDLGFLQTIIQHSGNGTYEFLSNKITMPSITANPRIAIAYRTSIPNIDFEIDGNFGTYAINLTTLGIDHLTTNQMDQLLNQYFSILAFIEGYNEGYDVGYDDGFDVGYDEGFNDGVASDTSYAVGYALGLSEGQDMETGSSLLILVVAAIGFIMMIFGFTTKRGIFNLLSVGAFIVLGTLLVQFIGFIVITAGLVIINVYYAFFGNS